MQPSFGLMIGSETSCDPWIILKDCMFFGSRPTYSTKKWDSHLDLRLFDAWKKSQNISPKMLVFFFNGKLPPWGFVSVEKIQRNKSKFTDNKKHHRARKTKSGQME